MSHETRHFLYQDLVLQTAGQRELLNRPHSGFEVEAASMLMQERLQEARKSGLSENAIFTAIDTGAKYSKT